MRALLAIVLLVGIAGCAPEPGVQRVEVEGKIRSFTAAGDRFGYLLEVHGEGMLALDVGELVPPLRTSGVIVAVPDSLEIPADASGQFAALVSYTDETGEGLLVIEFLG